MSLKRLLTLDDLYSFFANQNKTFQFNAKDAGYNISVQVPAVFEQVDDAIDGLLPVRLKVCHTGINRNKSRISMESMQDALPSLHYRPILAFIATLSDGTKDFTSHEIEIDPETNETIYIEKPIGVFSNPDGFAIEHDDNNDKDYVGADGYIYEDYNPDAVEIIQRKNGTKVSAELMISDLSFDVKDKILDIKKFRFGGCTCLGTDPDTEKPINEGMEGSRLDLADFSKEKNGVFSDNSEDKIIKMLQSMQDTLARFEDITNSKKGGTSVKLKELLEKYSKTEKDLDFDYSHLSDEELEAKFEEEFGDDSITESEDEPTYTESVASNENEDKESKGIESDSEDPEKNEEGDSSAPVFSLTKTDNGVTVSYAISHEDIRSSLYDLLDASLSDEERYDYYINTVYDDSFIYSNWEDTKTYRQKYIHNDTDVAFSGEREELFKEYLNADEKASLDEMRSNYENLQNVVRKYEAAEDKAKKEAVFSSEDYSELIDRKDFKDLMKHASEFSVEDVAVKADLILAKYAKEQGQFAKTSSVSEVHKINLPVKEKDEKKYDPYGGLFAED